MNSRLKTINAILVTERGRRPALLSADSQSADGEATITVDGVVYRGNDLPNDAYLIVNDSEIAALARRAGFALEPPNTIKRRTFRFLGKFIGGMLLLSAVYALFMGVQRALALDLPGALLAIGLSLFLALLGIYWWSYGEQELLRDSAPRDGHRN